MLGRQPAHRVAGVFVTGFTNSSGPGPIGFPTLGVFLATQPTYGGGANDAFLTVNLHREGISPFDILQPAYAGLMSGAFHPTAEAHAIVADHVMRHVRSILDKEKKPVVEGRLN